MATTRPTSRWLVPAAVLLTGLALTVVSPARAAMASPLHMQKYPSGDFGYVLIGEKVVQKYTVRNTSQRRTGPLATTLTGTDSLRAPAAKDHCDGRNLLPGATCRVTVRYTPELHYDATLNRFVSDAKGRLTVAGERRGWSATKRLAGVGDTQGTRLARPVCESFGGTLGFGLIQDHWWCQGWTYADQADYDGRASTLQTTCWLSGALSMSTTPYSDVEKIASSLCTSAGG